MSITTADNIDEVETPPPWPDANRRLIYGAAWIDPLKRLATFDDTEFEIFVLQWVDGYLKKGKYDEVQRRGAAGDKGRDIVAWIDPPGTPKRRWDLYQCKHYKNSLAPNEFHIELAKLCFYVRRGDYTMPQNYYVVTHQGVGNALQDLLDDPPKLVQSLKSKWTAHCESKITKGKIPLTGALLDFIDKVDLSIVHTVNPLDLIEQHAQTKYHAFVFGSQLKPRPPIPSPPKEIAAKETVYVDAMYRAFAEHLNTPKCAPDVVGKHPHLRGTFDHARVCFYSAESLKEFSRETWPDDSCFLAIADIIHQGVAYTMTDKHPDGYQRMRAACDTALRVQVDPGIPLGDPPPNDRIGICHHLANDRRIKWVVKDE